MKKIKNEAIVYVQSRNRKYTTKNTYMKFPRRKAIEWYKRM